MLFTKLKINNFGKFHNYELELKQGINLIYGENEAGKTTIHTFMKGMLFGIERARGRGAASKDDTYTKYLPWDYPGAYHGQMDIAVHGREYRLIRSFHANDKSFILLDLETGREIKRKEGLISELIPGLTEAAYRNTVSIGQLGAPTDAELASQVRNYITNLSVAGSKEVDVTKAVASLNEQKKALETAGHATELAKLLAEIEEGTLREEKLEELTQRLKQLLTEELALKNRMEAVAAELSREMLERMEQLPAILEKYEAYKELNHQEQLLERQIEEVNRKNILLKQEAVNTNALREELIEAGNLSACLSEYETSLKELKEEKKEVARRRTFRNLMVSLVPAYTIAVLAALLLQSSARIVVFAGAVIAGSVLCLFLNSRNHRYLKDCEERIRELEVRLRSADARWKELTGKYKVSTLQELTVRQEELRKASFALEHGEHELEELSRRRTECQDRGDLLQDQIMSYMQYFISEDELNELAVQRLKEIIRYKRQEVSDKQEEYAKQLSACRLMIEKLRWEISALEGNEAQLLHNKEQYSRLEQKQRENNLELEAIRLALSTIQELSVSIHDSFGRQLNHAVSENMKEITEQRYTDLKLDEKLEVKVCWNGVYIPLDRISAGTMDQVYLSLRLAAADLLLGRDNLPLVLDDSFAFYDENRMKSAIRRIADREQCLIFTCHKRELKVLEELKLPYHYVEL